MLHDTLDTALNSNEGAQLRSDGSNAASDIPSGQGEVSRLLAVIADQIAEADRRHGEALTEMKDRLQQLGNDARGARPQVPHEFAPAFARIEDALSQLAERITETRAGRASAIVAQAAAANSVEAHKDAAPTEAALIQQSPTAEVGAAATHTEPAAPASPMALRSAANPATAPAFNWGADFTRARNGAPAADPFDIVEMDGSAETWSALDAEALTRIYEDDTATRMALPVFGTQPAAHVVSEAAELAAESPVVVPMTGSVPDLSGFAAVQDTKPVSDAAIWADRTWLEGQFAELAERLQASMTEAPAHDMLAALDERLVQLEKHMGLSLKDVATRSDIEGLKIVEAHLEEMARQLDQTQGHLGRLDNIETQLSEVVEHLAAQFETRAAPAAALAPAEFQRMAEEAAETVAHRFAGSFAASATSAPTAANDDQLDSLRGLLESYISERRDGDEHSALMLDTMQQALIRVLDRIDAMETAQERAVRSPAPQAQFSQAVSQPVQAAPQHPYADRLRDVEHEAPAADMRRPADTFQVEPGYVPARDEATPVEPSLSIPAAAAAQHAPEQSDASSEPARSGIGKLRQDMIADAQRAKQRAAAEQAAKAADAAAGKPKRSQAAPAQGATASSPKLRLALLAILALLSAGAAYKMLIPAPVPVPVEEPAAAAPAKTGAPGAAQQQGSLPAAQPQVKVPGNQQAPAAGPEKPAVNGMINGMMFETDPPEEPVAAPVKVSNTDPLAPLPGMRLRQSTESVSPMNLAILQHQQNMANLSGKLGETAANVATPAAFMKEVPITALAATPATAAQPGAISTEVASTGARSSALDLPPVTVGPLSLRLAAAKGDASAEFEAASRLAEGKGTSQNFKEALRWYQRSAAQGFAQAQYRLGTLYERGLGIKADAATARSWYQRAAEQGNVKAMHNLAVLSAGRQNGSPDYATAAQWFTSAAERDLQDSQYNLGVLYESGMGVEQSPKVAMKWFSLAARAGDAESVRRRDALKAQLTQKDLADVAGEVAAFEAVKVSDPLVNDARAAGEDWKKRMDGNEQG